MIDEGLRPHRLRRGGAHLAVDRRLQRHREGGGRHGRATRPSANQISVSLPSLRVDAFTVGIAAELQRARRTGLTFAPEAGTWRMRQVINKLITDEDLYGAVESAYSQGWRRMKLYFLTGLPTETDEDTLAIAELARRCVEIGSRYTKGASVTVSVGGFVPKPFTPFQWFGQNTVVELSRKINLLRDDAAPHPRRAAQVARPQGHAGRGDHEPWRPPARAGHRGRLAPRRHLPGVVRALRPPALARRHGAPRPLDRLVRLPPPHRARGAARGTTSRPGSTRTSCGRTGATRSTSSASRTAAGRPATTAGPAPATASSTSWPRPRRRPAAARAPARSSSAWAGAAPTPRRRCPSRSGCGADAGALPVHQAGQGPLHQPPRRRPGVGAGPAPGRSCRWPSTEGFSPRPKVHFGLALPTAHESLGEYLDVDFRDERRRRRSTVDAPRRAAQPAAARRHRRARPRRPSRRPRPRCSRRSRAAPGRSRSLASTSTRADAAVEPRCSAPSRCSVTRQRKGNDVTDDIRPYILHLAVTGPIPGVAVAVGRPHSSPPAASSSTPSSAPSRGDSVPPSCSRPSGRTVDEGRVCRNHQWITIDGARHEPLLAGATSAALAFGRAS